MITVPKNLRDLISEILKDQERLVEYFRQSGINTDFTCQGAKEMRQRIMLMKLIMSNAESNESFDLIQYAKEVDEDTGRELGTFQII